MLRAIFEDNPALVPIRVVLSRDGLQVQVLRT